MAIVVVWVLKDGSLRSISNRAAADVFWSLDVELLVELLVEVFGADVVMIMRFSIADGNGELTGKFVVVWFLLSFVWPFLLVYWICRNWNG